MQQHHLVEEMSERKAPRHHLDLGSMLEEMESQQGKPVEVEVEEAEVLLLEPQRQQ